MNVRLALAVATSALLAGTAAARAESPRVDLAGCSVFDVDETLRAIAAELTSVPAERTAQLTKIVVTLTCPDTTTAIVTVTPAPADGPLEKRLDLGDLPADFRLRTVALAVAELVDAALDVAATMTEPAAGVASPSTPTRTPAPAEPAPREAPPVTVASLPVRRSSSAAKHSPIRGSVRGGVLVFLGSATTLPEVVVDASRGRLAADLFFATAVVGEPLGSLRAYAAGLGVAFTVACHGRPVLHVCAAARVAAGLAAVDATAAHDEILDRDAIALYVEAGPRLELRLERHAWSTSLLLGVAWSSGLSANAAEREVLQIGGPMISVAVAVGWRP